MLTLVWYPIMLVRRLFDRDPVRYATGRLFRDLGATVTKVNPLWKVKILGADKVSNPRLPYVVVSNHQSMADIPILSLLPWEMKWMAKKELFETPLIGWELKLAGDISVDRANPRSAVQSIRKGMWYLENKCSVMVFPEGTRSLDGEVQDFHDGAFRLAIEAGVPVLPIVVEGTFGCLPKKSWKFGSAKGITLNVLDQIDTNGMTRGDVGMLRDRTRDLIVGKLASLRADDPATAPVP